jgi:diguanylate cyclase (GGDEF)-like protein
MRDASPLTGLPGNACILAELERRIAGDRGFALMHVDIDHFKALNDRYGFLRGDEVIKMLARTLGDVVAAQDTGGFVGHIGGDDFVVICDPSVAAVVAADIIERFDRETPELYDEPDRRRGGITVVDRTNRPHDYPVVSVSIGVATTARRSIGSHLEASEIAAEMKSVAKRQPGSAVAIDRRHQ